jgi:hypothetical protein
MHIATNLPRMISCTDDFDSIISQLQEYDIHNAAAAAYAVPYQLLMTAGFSRDRGLCQHTALAEHMQTASAQATFSIGPLAPLFIMHSWGVEPSQGF